jgi:thiol-disulfide isomerase/thioredoxin
MGGRLAPLPLLLAALAGAGIAAAQPEAAVPAPSWAGTTWPGGGGALGPVAYGGRTLHLTLFDDAAPASRAVALPAAAGLATHFARTPDVAVVAIRSPAAPTEGASEALAAIAARHGIGFPLGDDPTGAVLRRYGARGTPWAVVIGRDGRVVHSGWADSFAAARRRVDEARSAAPAPSALVGQGFGDLGGLRFVTADGRPTEFRRDRLTLLRWWTTDCPYCRDSIPALADLWHRYRAHGLRLLPVFHPKSRRSWSDGQLRAYLRGLRFDGDFAVDLAWRKLEDLRRRGALTRATSVSVLVDGDGVVRWVHPGPRLHPAIGGEHADAEADFQALEDVVAGLLRVPRPAPGPGYRETAGP